jgi:xanthine dehydrogenase accessory factor
MTSARADLLHLASELTRRRESFVSATVVRREAPSSAQVGDAALITRDGVVHGWLGGSCTHHTVVAEALRTLTDGKPKLIAITADGAPRADGIAVFAMTCHSGGSVEIFIEPVLPAPRLTVFGDSAVAHALARIAAASGYEVESRQEGDAGAALSTSDRQFVVVATMGQYDEAALIDAITLAPTYLGLVASRTRFAQLRETLEEHGVAASTIESIHCPAGLDIGAHTPQEIAISILAEIVSSSARSSSLLAPTRPPPASTRPHLEVIDPVCGMTVTVTPSTPSFELEGRTYYFCCGGCRARFAKHPERYSPSPSLLPLVP